MEVEQIVPFMSIQCDWENLVSTPYKTFWVLCKFIGKQSVHANIKGITGESDNAELTATIETNSLCLRYNPTNHVCRFIPAFKVFSAIHSKAISFLDVADGGLGVSYGGDNRLLVWDNATGQIRKELVGHVGDVYKCKLFPSGIVVLSGGADLKLKIWSVETGQCPVSLAGHKAAITDFCFVDKGRNVVSVSKDGTAKLWDCGQSACLATVLETPTSLNCCSIGQVPENAPKAVVINEREVGTEDKLLLVGGEDGIVNGILLGTRATLFSINTESPINTILYLSPYLFVAGSQNGQIIFCNSTSGQIEKTIHESNSPILSMALYKDRGVLVGRQDGSITFYSLTEETTSRIQLTGSDCDPIYSVALTSNYIYTACRDHIIRKYKISDLDAADV